MKPQDIFHLVTLSYIHHTKVQESTLMQMQLGQNLMLELIGNSTQSNSQIT